jgi:hypothetical protein
LIASLFISKTKDNSNDDRHPPRPLQTTAD